MGILVYEYGLLQPIENGDLVRDQISKNHQYQNKLIEIEVSRRKAYRDAMVEPPEVAAYHAKTVALEAELTTLIETIRASRKTARARVSMPTESLRVKEVKEQLKALRVLIKAEQQKLKDSPVVQARVAIINDDAHTASLAAREWASANGVYWGTYLQAEAAVQAAKSSASDPKFKRWTGDGIVAVQIQKTSPLKDLFGQDTRVRVDPLPEDAFTHPKRGVRNKLQRTMLRLRVQSQGRQPVWAVWPLFMHRQLPKDAQVNWVKVIMRQRTPHQNVPGKHPWCRWVVQFTVTVPDVFPVVEDRSRVAIDIGWRAKPEGLRVAYLRDDQGNEEELVVPNDEVFDRLAKADSIRGFRDVAQDELRPKLIDGLKNVIALPQKVIDDMPYIHAWKAPQRFVRLLHTLQGHLNYLNDLDGMQLELGNPDREQLTDLITTLDAWRKRDLHLWQYETGLRQGAMLHRREVYRLFAKRIAAKYDSIVLEDFDLRSTATKANDEDTAVSSSNLRGQQRQAALYILRQCVVQAAKSAGKKIIEVPAAYTTVVCRSCKNTCKGSFAEKVEYTCEHCGETWDQDANACHNILYISRGDTGVEKSNVPRAARFSKRHTQKEQTPA